MTDPRQKSTVVNRMVSIGIEHIYSTAPNKPAYGFSFTFSWDLAASDTKDRSETKAWRQNKMLKELEP
jgi:hypothetical protein